MSALDQAFIKAYAKEPAPSNAAPSGSAPGSSAPAVAERTSRAPLKRLASTQIENIYADGTLYRIETPRAEEPEPVPPPHFTGRASRRMPLRYRLAQLENEEAAAPPAKRILQPIVQPARVPVPEQSEPPPAPRMKAQIPAPPPLPPAPVVEIEELQDVVESPLPILPPMANSVEVRVRWEELLVESPAVAESALSVWPNHEDFTTSQSSSLIALDLETMPEPQSAVTELVQSPAIEPKIETGAPEVSSAKTYRLDAAHASVPAPHEPPQPTVEDLIKPAAEESKVQPPEPQIQEWPLVI